MEDSNYATSLPIIWHPVQSRITTFQPDDAMMDDWAQWWRQTFNDEPLQTETRPREQLRSVNGPVDHGIMVITDRPGRTDFVLQPHAGQPNAPLSPSDPTTPYSEIVNSIANPIKGWLQSRSTIYRLAVGAVLLSPSPDIHAVYAKLSTLLHSVELDGLTEPDFSVPGQSTSGVSFPTRDIHKQSHNLGHRPRPGRGIRTWCTIAANQPDPIRCATRSRYQHEGRTEPSI